MLVRFRESRLFGSLASGVAAAWRPTARSCWSTPRNAPCDAV